MNETVSVSGASKTKSRPGSKPYLTAQFFGFEIFRRSRRSVADSCSGANCTAGAGCGSAAGRGLAARAVPHSSQNFALGLLTAAQAGHFAANAAAHSLQNFAPSRFSAPQLEQRIFSLPRVY